MAENKAACEKGCETRLRHATCDMRHAAYGCLSGLPRHRASIVANVRPSWHRLRCTRGFIHFFYMGIKPWRTKLLVDRLRNSYMRYQAWAKPHTHADLCQGTAINRPLRIVGIRISHPACMQGPWLCDSQNEGGIGKHVALSARGRHAGPRPGAGRLWHRSAFVSDSAAKHPLFGTDRPSCPIPQGV